MRIRNMGTILLGGEVLVVILREASSGMGQVCTSITTSSKVTRHRRIATAIAIDGKFPRLGRCCQQHQTQAGQFHLTREHHYHVDQKLVLGS
jgi:hypothetical protein